MRTCYNCNTPLANKTRTAEHVLPNAIGGKLISYKLLCRNCNIAFGETVDAELAIQFDNLVRLLNVKRDRRKRYRKSGDEQPRKIFQPLEYFLDEFFTINLEAAGDQFLKAIAKIAVSIYLHFGGNRCYIKKIIDILNDRVANDNDICFHQAPILSTWNGSEVLHCVHIKGCPLKRSLDAQVILFSSFSFLVKMNDRYDGEGIEHSYCYDIVGEQVVEKILSTDCINQEDYPEYPKSKSGEADASISSSFELSLARVLSIAESQ